MSFLRSSAAVLGLAAILVAGVAHAEGPKTRAQVLAELHEALRTGDMPADDDSNLLEKDRYRKLYAKVKSIDAPMAAASSPAAPMVR